MPVPDGGSEIGVATPFVIGSVMAIVASFSVMGAATTPPHARQNRLLTGTSVEHDVQRITKYFPKRFWFLLTYRVC